MEKMMGKDTVEEHSEYKGFVEMAKKILELVNSNIRSIGEKYDMSISEFWTGLFEGNVDQDRDVTTQILKVKQGAKKLERKEIDNIVESAEKNWLQEYLQGTFGNCDGNKIYYGSAYDVLEIIKFEYDNKVKELCGKLSIEKMMAILCVGTIQDYCWVNPSADIKKMAELLVSRNEEEKALEEKLAESKKGNGIVVVHGSGQMGKTTLVKKLLMNRKTVLFENKSYDEINTEMRLVNEIAFERFLSDKDILKDDLKGKLDKIPKEEYPVIVIDNFDKSLDELKNLDEFSKELQIAVVVITRKVYEIGIQLEVGRMKPKELEELFKIVYETMYIKQLEKEDKKGDIPEIASERIEDLRKAVCNNAMFMAFIAEAYAVEKFNNIIGDGIVGKVLNQKKMIDKKDMKSEGKPEDYTSYVYQLCKSIKGEDSTSDRQQRHTGEYLKRVFQDRIEGQDIPYYILLSCLDETEVPENCLVKWFGLKKDKIEYFVNEGWCMKDGDMITPFVPRYLIFQMNNAMDAKKENLVITDFLERFLKEIRNESTIAVDMQIIKAVMLKLYNFLTDRLVKEKKYLDLVADLRISCIRFCIQMYDAESALELLDGMSGSVVEKDEVVEQCFKASIFLINGKEIEEIEEIKQLENDYLKKIEEEICEYSEEKCMAVLEYFNIVLDNWLLNWIRIEYSKNEFLELPISTNCGSVNIKVDKKRILTTAVSENYVQIYKLVVSRIYYKNTEKEIWLLHYDIIVKFMKNLSNLKKNSQKQIDATVEIRNMGCFLWELRNQYVELLEIQNKDENVSRLVRIQTGCFLLDALCLDYLCQKYLEEYAKFAWNNHVLQNELWQITTLINQTESFCINYINMCQGYFTNRVWLRYKQMKNIMEIVCMK